MARPKKYKTEEERKRARAGWNKKWIDKNLEKVRKNQRNSYRRRKKRLGEKLNLSVRICPGGLFGRTVHSFLLRLWRCTFC